MQTTPARWLCCTRWPTAASVSCWPRSSTARTRRARPPPRIVRGEYQISGMSNRRLQAVLPEQSSGQIGRILKRLRLHGLIKKVGKTFKYYLIELERRAVVVGLKLKEHLIVPGLATASA